MLLRDHRGFNTPFRNPGRIRFSYPDQVADIASALFGHAVKMAGIEPLLRWNVVDRMRPVLRSRVSMSKIETS